MESNCLLSICTTDGNALLWSAKGAPRGFGGVGCVFVRWRGLFHSIHRPKVIEVFIVLPSERKRALKLIMTIEDED